MSLAQRQQSIRNAALPNTHYFKKSYAPHTTDVAHTVPVLRPMTLCDIPSVQKLERRAYQFPWGAKVFLDCLLAQYQCWVAELGTRIVGYGIMSTAAEESHVLNLCVDPNFHKKGYGSQIVRFLSDTAAALYMRRMLLEVRPSNQAALALYLATGFKQIGIRKNYYPTVNGREDALVLSKLV